MTRARRSSSLFDRWSRTYDDPRLQWSTYRPIHDAVLARTQGAAPATVVDLGCGTGQLTQRLLDAFPTAAVVAVDMSDGMLARARERLQAAGRDPAGLVRADAQSLPFAPGTVDLVVCTESFHWYQDQFRALEGLATVLRPGGRVMIASIATLTDLGDRLVTAASRAGGTPIRAVPPHRLRQLLVRSGFEVLHQRRIPRLGLAAWPVLTDARRR